MTLNSEHTHRQKQGHHRGRDEATTTTDRPAGQGGQTAKWAGDTQGSISPQKDDELSGSSAKERAVRRAAVKGRWSGELHERGVCGAAGGHSMHQKSAAGGVTGGGSERESRESEAWVRRD